MAYKLQLKRGLLASLPNGSIGEPLFTTDTFDLYVGKGDGTNVKLQKFIASGSSSQFLKGDGSLDSNTYQGVLSGTGIVKSTGGTISYLTDNTANWDAAYNDKINSASVSGTTTKTLTLTQQDGGTITASWSDYDTAPVTSVFGRTGAVVAASGDYTTSLVTEGTNLYFTDARARAAITLTTTGSSGSATYIGGTLNIPTYTLAGLGGVPTSRSLTINGTSYDLSADRSWSVGTVTSIDMSVPTGFAITGNPITSSGTLALAFATGYSLPTNASQTNWDAAYNDKINSASVTGTTTKTLTLNQQDGGTITASWTDINTDAVTSVFGRTGAVVAASGDYTTTQVTEGTNLYFTNARAIGSTLTGYISGAGTITSADSILSAIQKLNGNVAALVTGVSSVNGFTGAVTLSTTNIAEGTNLYFTQARVSANTDVAANTAARHSAVTLGTANGLSLVGQALSLGTSSSTTTGALSSTDWTTFNSKQAALNGTGFVKISGTTINYDNSTYYLASNPSNYITLTSLSGTSPISYNNTTGAFSISQASGTTNGFLSSTDWTTFNNKQSALTNPVTGTGTTNYLPKFTGSTTLGNSIFQDNGTNSGLSITPNANARFSILANVDAGALALIGRSADNVSSQYFYANDYTTLYSYLSASSTSFDIRAYANIPITFYQSNTERMRLTSTGLGIGTTSPNTSLEANGKVRSTRSGVATQYLELDGGTSGAVYLTASGASKPLVIQNNNTSQSDIWFDQAVASQYLWLQAGTEKMRLNASGNLGLGVTPSAWSTSFGIKVIDTGSKGTFYASDNDANVSFNQYFDGTNAIYKTTGTASRFALIGNEFQWRQAPSGTAGNAITFTQAMTLNASGNLSIGNTNNTYKLDVSGTGRFTSEVTVGYGLIMSAAVSSLFSQDGTLSYYSTTNGVYLNGAGAGGWLRLQASGVENNRTAINIFGSTAGTADQIRFRTNTADQLIIASTGAATFSSNVGINGAGTAFPLTVKVATNQNVRISSETNTAIQAVNDAASAYVALKLDGSSLLLNTQSGGNVGIGTTSPAVKLHVDGTGTQYIRVSSNTASTFQQLFAQTGGAGVEYKTLYRFVDTDNGERARLDASGNLGLGVTPSAWNSTFNVFQIGSTGSLYSRTSGIEQTGIASNAYFASGTNDWRYITSTNATYYLQSGGVHYWLNAASGTAGNAISFTQAMTLTAGGNLQLGTTSGATHRILSYTSTSSGTGSALFVRQDGSDPIAIFSYLGQILMQLNSTTGNLGIGTTNPQAKLEILGTSSDQLRLSTASTEHYRIGRNASTGYLDFYGSQTGYTGYTFGGVDGERMRITSDGRVAIGTTGPAYKLDVQGTSNTVAIRALSNTAGDILFYGTGTVTGDLGVLNTAVSATSNAYGQIVNTNTSTGSSFFNVQVPAASSGDPFYQLTTAGATNWSIGIKNSDSDKLYIGPNASPSSGSPSMVLTTGGNVLVGTTSDAGSTNKIQVNGRARINGELRLVDFVGATSNYWDTYHYNDNTLRFNYNGSGGDELILSTSGNLQLSGTIKTAAPTGYSAQPWKLGDATSGTISTNYYIKVEINGQIYSIPALQGTP